MPDAAPQRSDALKNRALILEVAHDALAESPDASLNSIAKRAGVGPGTLYRHFPTREALILEVHRHDTERLVASVPDVLAAHPRSTLCADGSPPSRATCASSTGWARHCTPRPHKRSSAPRGPRHHSRQAAPRCLRERRRSAARHRPRRRHHAAQLPVADPQHRRRHRPGRPPPGAGHRRLPAVDTLRWAATVLLPDPWSVGDRQWPVP